MAIVTSGATVGLLFHTPTKYGSDRFRQIFIDHWERWWDYCREEIPADQRAYAQKTVEKMMGCRNLQCGYARYVCLECHEEPIVPFSCKSRFCPSCGKVRTDEWVNRISKELLDVPHLHLTLTIAKEMRPYFDRDRSLLKLLLTTAADAVRQVVAVTYGDMRVGLVYTCHTVMVVSAPLASRIVPTLYEGAGVTTTRNDVHVVVTEYGVAWLHGKTVRERARALIEIAHPRFRDELTCAGRELGYL